MYRSQPQETKHDGRFIGMYTKDATKDAEGGSRMQLTKNTMQNSRPAAMRTANKNNHPICRVWSQELKHHGELSERRFRQTSRGFVEWQ